jgi:SAM-dependent methyltransferase
VWHDIECGGYQADLVLWEELTGGGDVLDLGCGTGRVALHLARRGRSVTGLDSEPAFVSALNGRSAKLPAGAVTGDARDFALDSAFDIVLAPMQVIQLLAGFGERQRCLRCVAAHLRPGRLAAFAIVEDVPEPVDSPPPLPDTREVDGWVYSSLPLETALSGGEIVVRRLRQTVSPAGALSEAVDEVRLSRLDAATLEREAAAVGLRAAGRREVPPTEAHVGSLVVLLEKEAA